MPPFSARPAHAGGNTNRPLLLLHWVSFSARPAHAGGDALHSDGEGISQNLDVGLVFIIDSNMSRETY
jgi:hypothetical protein